MNVMEAICSRKSIRKFTGEMISDDELKTILKAAYAAPVGSSAYDTLELSVVTSEEIIEAINSAAAHMFGRPDIRLLYGAPMIIIVSTKVEQGPMANAAYSNVATIIENMALAAVELGVGACHIWGALAAFASSSALVGKLGLPEGCLPCGAIVLGKTDEKYEPREIEDGRIKTTFID